MAFGPNGRIYLAGRTDSASFPDTPGAFQGAYRGGPGGSLAGGDAFVAKINPSASDLEYSTFLLGQIGSIAEACTLFSPP